MFIREKYKISPINNTSDKVVSFAESSQDHAVNMKNLEQRGENQINEASQQSTAKVKQTASNDGVSTESVEGQIEQSKGDVNNKFENIQNANNKRIKTAAEENKELLEKAKNN